MKTFKTILATACLFTIIACNAQGDKKKPSPATTATGKTASGTEITIKYGAPSVKGRTIGKDLEPMEGKVWRAGANDATTIEFANDVTIDGKTLAKGVYSFFTIDNGTEWTIIFNKNAKQWGAYSYKQDEDALRITTKEKEGPITETLLYTINNGTVSINWGSIQIDFEVK